MSATVEPVFTPWPYDAIARGVALLDERVPGWREKIQPDALRMQSCGRCILGQLFGEYSLGLEVLWPDKPTRIATPDYDSEYGFDLYSNQGYDHSTSYRERLYSKLADAWREAIARGAK